MPKIDMIRYDTYASYKTYWKLQNSIMLYIYDMIIKFSFS